jgi:hypothetical protein
MTMGFRRDAFVRQFFKYLNLHGGFLALVLILAAADTACSYNSSNVQSTDPSAKIPAATSGFAATQINPDQGLGQGLGASGAIAGLDGNTLTLTTQQGQLTVNIGTSTSIQKTVTGNTADLQIGQSVTVTTASK